MIPTAAETCLPIDTFTTQHRGDALAEIVRSFTAGLNMPIQYERRRHQRVPCPFLMKCIPIDSQNQTLADEETVVVGHDVSARGVSFFHPHPLPHRRALVTIDHPQAGRLTVEVELHRCRFHKLGWYESSGRLVRAVELMLPPASKAG